MRISGAGVRADEEASVIALLCEERLRTAESELQGGQTLFDYGQDEYGFCQPCNRLIDAFLDEEAEEGAKANGG